MELALVLPMFLALVFGMIQFGMYLSQAASIATAARSGARIGAVNLLTTTTCDGVVAATRSQASGMGLSPLAVRVTVSNGADEATATQRCAAPANGSVPAADQSATPCQTGLAGTSNLYVTADVPSGGHVGFLLFGRFANWTLPLKTTGVFRCEY